MKIYAAHGIKDFVVCCGYRGYMIKEWFANYRLHTADVTIDLGTNTQTIHRSESEDWSVTLVDTGDDVDDRRTAPAGEALPRGRADVLLHLRRRRRGHRRARPSSTSTAGWARRRRWQRSSRRDVSATSTITSDHVDAFVEKPPGDGSVVNGGFFVLDAAIFELPQRRRDRLRARAAANRSPRERELVGLPASRLLAAARHAARQEPSRSAVGGRRSVEEVVAPLCRGCGRALTTTLVDLGTTPISNAFIEPEDVEAAERWYPLHAYVCDACLFVQIGAYEPPEAIFNAEYAYFSSFADTWVEHARALCAPLRRRTAARRGHRWSSSSRATTATCCGVSSRSGSGSLGVEPAANVAAAAEAVGVPTLVEFFGVGRGAGDAGAKDCRPT